MRHDYTLFKRAGTKTWYFYFQDEDTGKRIGKSTRQATKYKAERYAEDFLDAKDHPKSRMKLKDFTKDFFIWDRCGWIKRQHAKGRSFTQPVADFRRGHIVNHILPEFGSKVLSRLNRVDIENWLIDLPLANQTKNHILYTLAIILRDAEAIGYIEGNPLEKIEPMGKNARSRDVFTIEEYHLLFPQEEKDLLKIWENVCDAVLFMILATTGIRSGEVRALHWAGVLENYTSLIIREAVKPKNNIAGTKSGAVRVVLLPKRMATLLASWHDTTPYGNAEDLVFFGIDRDRPLNRKTLCCRLVQALHRAGINAGERQLVPHSFRHFFNTSMRNLLPENVLRELVGHKTISMTDRYDHPGTQDLLKRVQGARPLIENFWK